jgi:hypothetical protein
MIIEGVPQFSSPNLRDNREKRSNALPEGHTLNSISANDDMAAEIKQNKRTKLVMMMMMDYQTSTLIIEP